MSILWKKFGARVESPNPFKYGLDDDDDYYYYHHRHLDGTGHFETSVF